MFFINRETIEVPDWEGWIIGIFVFLVKDSFAENRDSFILYYLVVSGEIYALRTFGRLDIRIKLERVHVKGLRKSEKRSEPGK